MKVILITILLLAYNIGNAATYYFSTTDGNDSRTSTQAQSSSTPWKTLAKFTASAGIFGPGDSINFKRGDVFVGGITTVAGTSGNNFKIGAYGSGANPVFSGFKTLSTWNLYSGNIYWDTLNVQRLQMVTVDGVVKGMGRYPNTTFLQYTNHSGAAWISGTTVGALPFNPTGAEAVVRKDRYYVDRQIITSRASNTLNLSTSSSYGSNAQEATNNNGYFIQGHISTLDTDGEWYYDNASHRLYVYFASPPSGRVVQAGAYDVGIESGSLPNVSINNIKFTGYNKYGISADYSGNINVRGCNFEKIGIDGIHILQGSGGINIYRCFFSQCLNSGSNSYQVNNVNITYCKVDSIHMIIGMGNSGDAAGNGLFFYGNNQVVSFDTLTNIGFSAIAWYEGNNVLCEKNFIDGYCLVKDDGGGIYTYGIFDQTFVNRIIRKNIILHGIGNYDSGLGAYAGFQAYGLAFGVYLDNFATETTVTDNFIENAEGGGIFDNLNRTDTIINNTIYDTRYGIVIQSPGTVRNILVSGNTVIAKTPSQIALLASPLAGTAEIPLWGNFANNYYARPISEGSTVRVDGVGDMTIATWRATYGHDIGTLPSQVAATSTEDFRSDYNYTPIDDPVSLGANYKSIANETYSSIVVPAYDGSVLIYYSSLSPGAAGRIKVTRGLKIKVNLLGQTKVTSPEQVP